MQSHYEINVAKDGYHLFATAERSLVTESKAKELVALMREKFPESEGYDVTCSYTAVVGRKCDF